MRGPEVPIAVVTGPGGVQEVVPRIPGVGADLFGGPINSSGEMIGNAQAPVRDGGESLGYTWQFSPTGNPPYPNIFPNLAAFTNLFALTLNNSGQIVGYSTGPNNLVHAFLSNGQSTLDLNSLIPPNLGLNLYAATGISDAGQIVGLATDQAGNIHEVELIPTTAPEPSTLACFLVGSLALAATHRRSNRKAD